MRKALNIKIYFRKNADGKTFTVYFKIFLNGTKTQFTTGLIVDAHHIAKNGTLKNAHSQAEIERMKIEIRDKLAYLNQRLYYVSAKMLRDEWLKPKPQTETLQVIDNYIAYKLPKVENSTYKTYFTYRKNFVAFLKYKRLERITVYEMNIRVGREYLDYLDTHTNYSNIHKAKCITFLKSVLRYAQREELIGYTSFVELKRPKHTPKLAT